MSASTETWLAAGYALFLLAASTGLRWLAARTARGPADFPDASWPRTDAARFERGLARVLVVLAAFILLVTLVRHGFDSPVPILALLLLALSSLPRADRR